MPRRNRNAGQPRSAGPRQVKGWRPLVPSDAALRIPADNAIAAVTTGRERTIPEAQEDADEARQAASTKFRDSLEQEVSTPMNDPQSQVNPQRRTARVHAPGRALEEHQELHDIGAPMTHRRASRTALDQLRQLDPDRRDLSSNRDRSMRAYEQNPRALGTNPRERRA